MTNVASPIICRSALAIGAQRGVASFANTSGIGCAQPTISDRWCDTRVPGPSVDESVSMRSMVPTNCTMSNVPDGSNGSGSNGWLVCHSACRKRGPAGGERQKVALVPALLAGDGLRGAVHARAAGGVVGRGIVPQGFMKMLQHRMQPVAKVSFVDVGGQFVGFLQTQLAQRKKAVGAVPQVGV